MPVRWKLRDINFVVHDYKQPQGAADADPATAVNAWLGQAFALLIASNMAIYLAYRIYSRSSEPRPPPLGDSRRDYRGGRDLRGGGGGRGVASSAEQLAPGMGGGAVNQYGDSLGPPPDERESS